METKKYRNDDVTVTWEPSKCIHSAICFKGLSSVFNPNKKPWISLSGSDTETIVNQVKQCPSGAISFIRNTDVDKVNASVSVQNEMITIKVTPAGPLIIQGNFLLQNDENISEIKNKTTAFCRCGHSAKKPYCDGSHHRIQFEGT